MCAPCWPAGQRGRFRLLSTARPYRCGGLGGPLNYTDIPEGPLSVRHVFDLYPFPNTLRAGIVTGRDLRARLERSAALFRRIRPGAQDQPLLDPEVPGFAYETIRALATGWMSRAPRGSGCWACHSAGGRWAGMTGSSW